MFPSTASTASHSTSGVFGPIGLSDYGGTSGLTATRLTCNGVGGQKTGSRLADYKRTAEYKYSADKLVSISAMPVFQAKSHEELRLEDHYNFIEKGDQSGTTSWGTTSIPSALVKANKNPFERTFPATPAIANSNPFDRTFPSTPAIANKNPFERTFPFTPVNANNNPFERTFPSTPAIANSNPFDRTFPSTPAIANNPFERTFPSTPAIANSNPFERTFPSTPAIANNNPFERTFPSTPAIANNNPFERTFPFTPVNANNNPFERAFPSKATTWNYPGPTSTSFTSQPLQISPSANTCLARDAFISRTDLTSTASTSVSSTAAQLFNPFSPRPTVTSTEASTGSSSFSFPLLKQNPFINPSTSFTTHTSSTGPRFEAFTGVVDSKTSSLNHFWPTPIPGPFVCAVTAAANSSSVSPGFTSTFNQPAKAALVNPYGPSSQNCNGSTTAAANSSSVSPGPGFTSTFNQPAKAALVNPCGPSAQDCNGSTTGTTASVSQLSSEKPTSAANPFGTLPPKPVVFFDGSPQKPSIQYGISSIPVKDKPDPVKSSLLTPRRSSGRIKLPVRKYDPTLNTRKIAFFSDTADILPAATYIPRENPRALVVCPERWPLRPMVENERDDQTDKKQASTAILDVPSTLRQSDYYTLPQISELEAKELAEPGSCRRVKDFVVGRHGYGSIKFLTETDVTNIDLEYVIQFNNREVIVYADDTSKPPVGEGLNKPAEITLLNVKCIDKKTGMQYMGGSKINKYIEMLKKKAVAQGVEFMSYDPVEGEWKFRVQHF